MQLKDKNVLLIAPIFFGYADSIKNELIRRGASVDFIADRPFQSSFMKAITRIKRQLVMPFVMRYFLNNLKKFNKKNYDLVLIINGETISPELINLIRKKYPLIEIILYMWDSLSNRINLIANLPYYDRCLTFDSNDAEKYGLKFRPLFFSNEFSRRSSNKYKYDLSFIGTMHSDRYKIISDIKLKTSSKFEIYLYLYLQAKWVFYFYKYTSSYYKKSNIKEFSFEPMPRSMVKKIFNESKVIVDIEHPKQTGLTMRTIEALGSEKKLITTNHKIKDYDFYDPKNIFLLDRYNPTHIPASFFEESYSPIHENLYSKYSIKGWLDDVLGLKSGGLDFYR